MRSLLLLRHARTEASRPGHPDHARRLTPEGEQQAARLGHYLRSHRTPIDLVLCSPATRTRQTADAVGSTAPTTISDRLYNAGGDDIIAVLHELDDDIAHVLVVGHAPGLPAVVHDLVDPETSDPEALITVESQFPAATLALMSFFGAWSDLEAAALVSVRLP